VIDAQDLTGIDTDLALRVLGIARSFAPGIDLIGSDGEAAGNRDRLTAIAILKGVAVEARSRGSRLVKGQRIGPAGVDYRDAGSWFSDEDKDALRALASAGAAASTGGPVGYFPKPGRIGQLWPEEY